MPQVARLPGLKELNFPGNQLTSLPDGLFDGLPALERLFFGGNQVTHLRSDTFKELTNLQWLYFAGNALTALPDGLFVGLSRMRWVWFHDNPGAPFSLKVYPVTRDVPVSDAHRIARVAAETATGAPFDMRLALSVTGGVADAPTLLIRKGTSSSTGVVVITRDGEEPVWVAVGGPPGGAKDGCLQAVRVGGAPISAK